MSNQISSYRPGLKAGRSNEFTLLAPLKPGEQNVYESKLGPDKISGTKTKFLLIV